MLITASSVILGLLFGLSYFFVFSDGYKNYSEYKRIREYLVEHPDVVQQWNDFEKSRSEINGFEAGKPYSIPLESPPMEKYYKAMYEPIFKHAIKYSIYAFLCFLVVALLYFPKKREKPRQRSKTIYDHPNVTEQETGKKHNEVPVRKKPISTPPKERPTRNPTQKKEEEKTLFDPKIYDELKRVTKEKKKEGDKLKPASQNKENTKGKVLFTNYKIPSGYTLQNAWIYPKVTFPKEGTVIRTPRELRRQRRGHLESIFENKLRENFGKDFSISGEHSIPTSASSRPYEPDISIIELEGERNIFIDVEIDEPYAAIKRNPMHCLGEDDLRDHFFNDRGWIVIRFTEKQIKQHHKKCLAFIAKVINSIDPRFAVSNELSTLPPVPTENQWTALEAQKLEKINYRESYLGIESFGDVPIADPNEAIALSETESKIEKLVIPSIQIVGDNNDSFELNNSNVHPRDGQIQFIEAGHIYLINGVQAKSVTELIDSCFPIYDEMHWSAYIAARDDRPQSEVLNQWKRDGFEAQQLGTALHKNIEKFYHGQPPAPDGEFQQFLNFHESHRHLQPFRTEWRIFDEVNLVAGTIDLLCKNADGTYEIYDWKRSKKVVNPLTNEVMKINSFGNTGLGLFRNLSDTSYSRYALQQNIYRHILETYYSMRIRNMYLVIMHPLLNSYHKIEVPRIETEVNILLSKNY